MTLYCPFCHAPENGRVEAVDEQNKTVLLIMFSCPFHFKFHVEDIQSDSKMQEFLEDWRSKQGSEWLESVGPIMKAREMKNISAYEYSKSLR